MRVQSTVLQRLLNQSSAQSVFYTLITHVPTALNALFSPDLSLRPLQAQLGLNEGALTQSSGIGSVIVAH